MAVVPGRPKGDSDARARLIATALELFSRRSFQTVSTRELAREAGVDAALIRYYFGSKAGLFEQMVRETLAPLVARFRQLAGEPAPNDLNDVMRTYYRIMAPNPVLPRLLLRVLQEGDGSEPYPIVLSVFNDMIQLSRQWLTRSLVDSGRLWPGMDPELARLSIVSLMVFPLIAPPVLMRQFGVTLAEENLNQLVEHHIGVLHHGIVDNGQGDKP